MGKKGGSSAGAKVADSTGKRDALLEIEKAIQQCWEDDKIFERDAPLVDSPQFSEKKKFMATFPYPYMNGRLHLGHVFSLTKAEFAVGFERLMGKDCLFPFAFHCTGMPIQASAMKLKAELDAEKMMELEKEKNDSISNDAEKNVSSDSAPAAEVAASKDVGARKFGAKRTKAAQKGAGKKQSEILISGGVSKEEIPKFIDPVYWTQYFPTLGESDLKRFGLKVDWRRSFITTDLNPYYDSFIRWQFEILKSQDRVRFGKRFTVYSPRDQQACADHDRATGEGVGPQEYVAVKLQLSQPYPAAVSRIELPSTVNKISFLCATLRPETMYGQTNFWVLPTGKYGLYRSSTDDEVFCISETSARNLAYQGHSKEFGDLKCYGTIKGSELIGCLATAQLIPKPIRALPLTSIKMDKGTGVVTCVPTDAPDDWMMLEDLKKDEKFRTKWGVKPEWVNDLKYTEIIETKYGRLSAKAVIDELGIKSMKDAVLLQQAKEMVYREGFYKGKMLISGYEGKSVVEVKDTIKDLLLGNGGAIPYVQPESPVISRSGDECVVALMDQWYIPYGEGEWQAQVLKHIDSMEMYLPETKEAMIRKVHWLKQWACSRSFGLGTRLPWDEKYVIESLSDSTIYMAFYTVAHILQGIDNLDGRTKESPFGISPEAMTPAVWDFIFRGKDLPKEEDCAIDRDLLKRMRNEYLYWYPLDLRVSGKDLIGNHLVFWLYNHLAVMGEEMSPRGMRTNGFLLLNNEKMSKQTGNFLSLADSIDQYGSDATRIGLAEAGDSANDANFVEKVATAAILGLNKFITLAEEVVAAKDEMRSDNGEEYHARVFRNDLALCLRDSRSAYSKMLYREALRNCWFGINIARDKYRAALSKDKKITPLKELNGDLMRLSIEIQLITMSPIAPHVMEHVWKNVWKKSGSIIESRWPEAMPVDVPLLRISSFLETLVQNTRRKILRSIEVEMKHSRKQKRERKPNPNMIYFQVMREYPQYLLHFHKFVEEFVKSSEDGKLPSDGAAIAFLSKHSPDTDKRKERIMNYFQVMKNDFEVFGDDVFSSSSLIDEANIIQTHADDIARALNLEKVLIWDPKTDENAPGEDVFQTEPFPRTPAIFFLHREQ